MNEVTRIISALDAKDPLAAEQLLPFVYQELRKLASRHLKSERRGHSLDATALVHEAYLKLIGGSEQVLYNDRGHFFAAAATAMRRILIDRARRRRSLKRGGGQQRVPLDDLQAPMRDEQLVALDEALVRLAEIDPQKAKLVELRHFAGLTGEQAAQVLGISPATADRYWSFARAWLQTQIRANPPR